MKTTTISTITALAVGSGLLLSANSSRAEAIVTVQPVIVAPAPAYPLERVAFSDSAEAGLMIQAYDILASSDHDYDGHRLKAMHQVEAAAKLLGVKLHGDAKDRQKQVISDDKMREAQGMLEKVLNNSEVKSQDKISKHVSEAVHQISLGLDKK